MSGVIEVKNVAKVRDGVWLIVYTHTCDCGCSSSRHNLTFNGKNKPTDSKAKQLANDDYGK